MVEVLDAMVLNIPLPFPTPFATTLGETRSMHIKWYRDYVEIASQQVRLYFVILVCRLILFTWSLLSKTPKYRF